MKGKIIIWRMVTGIILISLACFFIYSAVFVMPSDNQQWLDSSTATSGKVIELKETYRNKAYCEYLVIQYTAHNNNTYTFTPYDCYSKGTFSTGQAVRIRYSKDKPETAALETGDNGRSTITALILFSLFMLGCGALFIFISIKKDPGVQH